MPARKFHNPGLGEFDPYLEVGAVVKDNVVTIDKVLYHVHWRCHHSDAIMTHEQITKRKFEARRHGVIGPCYICSRGLKLGGRAGKIGAERNTVLADRQRENWLRVPVARAWPKPSCIVPTAVVSGQ